MALSANDRSSKHNISKETRALNDSLKENKGERRKNEWEISKRETEHERLLTLGNEQGVVEEEVGGGLCDWVTGTERALDGMSTGCYAICWQIELQ